MENKNHPPNRSRLLEKSIVFLLVVIFGIFILLLINPFITNPSKKISTLSSSTSSNNIPNVSYTIYKPTFIPKGFSLGAISSQSIQGEQEIFQDINAKIGNRHVMITLRQAKYDNASEGYWVCSSSNCKRIGADKAGRPIFKEISNNGAITWGERLIGEGTFINLETDGRSTYADNDAIFLFNSLQKIQPSNTNPRISGNYIEKTVITSKNFSVIGEVVKFYITIQNGNQAWANKPISFEIESGSGPLTTPFAVYNVTTDNNGHASVKTTLPWSIFGQSYKFGASPIPSDITYDAPGSINRLYLPPVGLYFILPLLATTALIILLVVVKRKSKLS